METKLKNLKKKISIILAVILVVLVVIPTIATIVTHKYYFDKRINHKNNYFEYITSINEDFIKEDVYFTSDDGQELHGAFYSQEGNDDPKGLIIWVHGMFLNHENYLVEIEWLTKQNYVVFSYDNTGVDDSEGESLKGLAQSPIDLSYALSYLYDNDIYQDIPNILVGHSWGGFAVSSVYELDIPYEVDGIVSLAGFWQNVNVIEDIARNHVGFAVSLMHLPLVVYEYSIFGENSSLDGITGLSNIDAPVLIIHSEDDEVVAFEQNFNVYKDAFSENERFTLIEYTDAGHKLTVKKESYDQIHDIMHHQLEYSEDSEKFQELEDIRHSLITDLNLDVMNDILDFCNAICEN